MAVGSASPRQQGEGAAEADPATRYSPRRGAPGEAASGRPRGCSVGGRQPTGDHGDGGGDEATFLTADDAGGLEGLPSDDDEELIRRLWEAADGALLGARGLGGAPGAPSPKAGGLAPPAPTAGAAGGLGGVGGGFASPRATASHAYPAAERPPAADAAGLRSPRPRGGPAVQRAPAQPAAEAAPDTAGAAAEDEVSPPLCASPPACPPPGRVTGRSARGARQHVASNVGGDGPARRRAAPTPAEAAVPMGAAQRRARAIAQQLAAPAPAPEPFEDAAPPPFAKLGELGVRAPLRGGGHGVLDSAARRLEACRAETVASSAGQSAQPPVVDVRGADGHLPASELSCAARAALTAWAAGRISGVRCLLEMEAATPATTESSMPSAPGRPSWTAIACLCGLHAGEAFATGSVAQAWASAFGCTPAVALRRGAAAVREEAELMGPVTIEELHLGLRAVELRAGGEGCGCLHVKAWRELLRVHLEGQRPPHPEDSPPSAGARGLAASLAGALGSGAAGAEQAARSEPQDALRALPGGWDECRKVLSSMARALRASLQTIRTYGAYTALGVGVDASGADLKRAYREMCLRHHPDKGGDTIAFQHVQRAYEAILDERKRGAQPPPPSHGGAGGQRRPERDAHERRAGSAGARASPSDGRGGAAPGDSRPWEPRPASRADEAAEAAAEERTMEALQRLADHAARAAEAAEGARSASAAAQAAAEVVCGAAREQGGDTAVAGRCAEVLAAAPELEAAMRRAAEDAEAAALAAGEASACVVPACGHVATGDHAERIIGCAQKCALQGGSVSMVASSCAAMADEIEEALGQVQGELRDPSTCYDAATMAAGLMASLAQRGRQAAEEVAEAAASVAAAVAEALALARHAAASAARRGDHARGRPPSARRQQPGEEGERAGPVPRRRRSRQASQERPSRAASPAQEIASGGGSAVADGSARRLPLGEGPRGRRSDSEDDSPRRGPGDARGHRADAEPRGPRPRSGSSGPRGWREAMVQRRLEALEELQRSDAEVRGLQRELHEELLRSPLLLPGLVGPELRHRAFALLGEVLLEAAVAVAEAPRDAAVEPLPFVAALGAGGGSICDPRLGVLRLAALFDLEACTCALQDEFLPAILRARPAAEEESLRATVSLAAKMLASWVSSRDTAQ